MLNIPKHLMHNVPPWLSVHKFILVHTHISISRYWHWYALVIKHGVLENPPFSSIISQLQTSIYKFQVQSLPALLDSPISLYIYPTISTLISHWITMFLKIMRNHVRTLGNHPTVDNATHNPPLLMGYLPCIPIDYLTRIPLSHEITISYTCLVQ